jgi:hypothetical protein
VLSRPTEITPVTIKKRPEDELSDARKLQLDFWTTFRERLLEAGVVASAQTPRGQYWFDVPVGRSRFVLSNIANTYEGRVGVRLYMSHRVADLALPQLLDQKEEIERQIGEALVWNPNPDNRDKIIALFRDTDLQDRDEWPKALDWLVDRLAKFRRVFMPVVKDLDLTVTSGPVGTSEEE